MSRVLDWIDAVRVDVSSSWAAGLASTTVATQATPPPPPSHAATQTSSAASTSVAVQTTDLSTQAALSPDALRLDGWQPAPDVVDFLRRAGAAMERQLRCDARTGALRALEELHAEDADASSDARVRHTLALAFVQPTSTPAHAHVRPSSALRGALSSASGSAPAAIPFPASSLSWNCAGTMLAVAFGHASHRSYCSHRAGVGIWRAGEDVAPTCVGASAAERHADTALPVSVGSTFAAMTPECSAPPARVFETASCVQAVAFHPELPSLLAAGLASGELLLWDVSIPHTLRDDGATPPTAAGSASERGEALIARSSVDDVLHRDAVTHVAWVREPASRAWLLASAGRDGKVLLWNPVNDLAFPVAGYRAELRVEKRAAEGADYESDEEAAAARRRRRAAAARAGVSAADMMSIPLGVSSISFSQAGACMSPFFVGAENGCVMIAQASVAATANAACSALAAARRSGGTIREHVRPMTRAGSVAGVDTALVWDAAAAALVPAVPAPERAAFVRGVERYARDAQEEAVSMGTVYRARPLATSLYTPLAVRTTLEAHATSVTCVAASPFLRNLVLSASADGTVRVCSALDRAPLLCLTQHVGFQIVPTLAVDWSTLRPAVFAASSASGAVFLYDLYTSTAKPAVVLLPDGSSVVMSGPGASSSAAASLPSYLTATSSFGAAHMRIPLAFNPQTACHLAAGSSSGAVHVWQLGGRFGSTQPQELALMKDFVMSTMTDAGRVIVASSRGGAMLEERGVSSKGDSDDAAPNSLGVFLQRVEEKTAAARSLL